MFLISIPRIGVIQPPGPFLDNAGFGGAFGALQCVHHRLEMDPFPSRLGFIYCLVLVWFGFFVFLINHVCVSPVHK